MSLSPSTTLAEYYQQVYKPQRLLDAGAGTLQQYELAIGYLDRFLKRPMTLADLTSETLSAFAAHELNRGMAVATVNGRLRYALTIGRHAKRKGIIGPECDIENISKLKCPRRLPRAWTEAEMESLVKSSELARGRFMGVPAGKWWRALLLVAYDTGMRRRPLFEIRFDEIDFEQQILTVPAERMKNECEQFFRLHPQTIEAILDTLPPRRKMVFPWPFVHQRALYGRYKVILRRAGLPFGRKDMFHKIRRTTASHIARLVGKGIASQHLGHRDLTTIDRYVDPRFTANHDMARALPRPHWTNPREILVEQQKPEPVKLGEPATVKYSVADLRGEGDDLFERLRNTWDLTGPDVRAALDMLGVYHRDFAREMGIDPRNFSRAIDGKRRIAPELQSKIRVYLGLTVEHCDEGRNAGERKAKVSA